MMSTRVLCREGGLTLNFEIATVHPCLSIKQVKVVLADDRYDRDLSLNSEMESALLEWEQNGVCCKGPCAFWEDP